MSKFAPLAFALLTTPLLCQVPPTGGPGKPLAYPNGTTTETGRVVDFPGSFDPATTSFDEGRYQMLIPATHLPTDPVELIAMNLIPHDHFGAPVRYEEFRVTMAHTTATALTDDFAANLGASPEVVISGFLSQFWSADDWNMVMLARMGPGSGFMYNGVDNLVVDIQASIDRTHPDNGSLFVNGLTFQSTSSPARYDLPAAKAASGTFGSGAINATTATTTLPEFVKLGLRFDFTLTSQLQSFQAWSDVGGANGNTWAIGQPGHLQVVSNPPDSFYLILAEATFLPTAASLYSPGFPMAGKLWVPTLSDVISGLDSGAPGETSTFVIPNSGALVGVPIRLQAVTLRSINPWDIAFTNALDFYINS